MKQAAVFAARRFVRQDRASLRFWHGISWNGRLQPCLEPPPAEYVLGAMPAATATTVKQDGLPVVEVKRVQLPDYLDTTDILERRGNQLDPELDRPLGRTAVGRYDPSFDRVAGRPAASASW